MDEVAVVILNYNGEDYLRQFLPSVIEHSQPFAIWVADNCSTDNSLDILASFPEVRTIHLKENFGYAGGYNQALQQISANFYVLLNSDVEVTPNWIQPQLDFLKENPTYGACQPKILDFKRKDMFEYAGASGGYLDGLGYPFCRGRILNHIEKDEGQYDHSVDIFWATGACLMVRSKIFHELKGLDADFFAHMEEIDLCWRMKSHGYKVRCIPQSKIFHVGGGTLDKTNARKTYLNFRNGISLLLKNMPKLSLLFILPIRLLLDWMASLLLWKTQSFDHFKAVWKAHKDALMMFNKHIQRPNRSSPLVMNQSFSILPIAYFLKGKKTFKRLSNTK